MSVLCIFNKIHYPFSIAPSFLVYDHNHCVTTFLSHLLTAEFNPKRNCFILPLQLLRCNKFCYRHEIISKNNIKFEMTLTAQILAQNLFGLHLVFDLIRGRGYSVV